MSAEDIVDAVVFGEVFGVGGELIFTFPKAVFGCFEGVASVF